MANGGWDFIYWHIRCQLPVKFRPSCCCTLNDLWGIDLNHIGYIHTCIHVTFQRHKGWGERRGTAQVWRPTSPSFISEGPLVWRFICPKNRCEYAKLPLSPFCNTTFVYHWTQFSSYSNVKYLERKKNRKYENIE